MPSSANRNTHLERTILLHFEVGYLRLHHSQLFSQAKSLSIMAQNTLDIAGSDLFATFAPRYADDDTALQRAEKEEKREFYAKLNREGKAMKRSALVWEAGSRCMDIGSALEKVGRVEEAREWSEAGDDLWGLAVKVMGDEEREAEYRKRCVRKWIGRVESEDEEMTD